MNQPVYRAEGPDYLCNFCDQPLPDGQQLSAAWDTTGRLTGVWCNADPNAHTPDRWVHRCGVAAPRPALAVAGAVPGA